MKTLFIFNPESKDQYNELVSLLHSASEAFSLTYYREDEKEEYSPSVQEIRKQLEPALIHSELTRVMPSMQIGGNYGLYELALYRTEIPQFSTLTDASSSLWDWDYPNLPMDLCFFRNGAAWFISSAHERFAYLYLSDDDMSEYLLAMLREVGLEFEEQGSREEKDLFHDDRTLPIFSGLSDKLGNWKKLADPVDGERFMTVMNSFQGASLRELHYLQEENAVRAVFHGDFQHCKALEMVFRGVGKLQLESSEEPISKASLVLTGDLWTWEADPGQILLSAKEVSWREIG